MRYIGHLPLLACVALTMLGVDPGLAERISDRSSAATTARVAAAAWRDVSETSSGYMTDQVEVSSASALLKVPEIACGPEFRSIYMGIEGFRVAADVILNCDQGEATYALEAFVFGANTLFSENVQPGDLVRLSVTQTATESTVTVVNGDTTLLVSGAPGPEAFLIFGTLDVDGALPPQFTTAKFSDNKLNGKRLSPKKTIRLNRVNGNTKIATGALKKGAFTQKIKVVE